MNRTTCAATLAAVLLSGCATLGEPPGTRVSEYRIDEVVPLPADGIAPVSFRAGPVEVVEVRVRNRPSAEDIAEDTRKTDTSHPKPVITAFNHGTALALVSLESILEDAAGTPLMVCNGRKPQELVPGVKDDWNTCLMEGMPTHAWPRVTHFHAKVTIRVRESAPAPAAQPATP